MDKIRPDWLVLWLYSIVQKSDFSVKNILFSCSKEWFLRDGALEHITGKFFRVVGVCFENLRGEKIAQLLIEQREVGTLGFLVREHNQKKKILVQAKIEPGNVGIVQLSPTCQATASNTLRAHGGKMPPFADIFSNGGITILEESFQSEQGSRFLGKFNRNVYASLENEDEISLDETHRWLSVDTFLSLLQQDYLVNTDARSVLVCSPWESLVDRVPFTRYQSLFAQELACSATCSVDQAALERILDEIRIKRCQVKKPIIVPFQDLNEWEITDQEICLKVKEGFAVRQIEVRTNYREVTHWDQPIMSSFSEGEIVLVCARINGVLHFLFRLQIEPGLENLIELGPTEIHEFGSSKKVKSNFSGELIAEVWQSEEGGRFFQDKNHYKILDIGEAKERQDGDYWLNLSQIQYLLKKGGWITNEARSALSLILTWL